MTSLSLRSTTLALTLALLPAAVAAGSWSTDFEKARHQAEVGRKDLLIDFTGSDWCSWCIKLRKEVFAQGEFEMEAAEKFVLVELDYPRNKTLIPEEVAEQNAKLLVRYPIKGYPTVLLCDPMGRPFAATGYQPGGPRAYLGHLEDLSAKKAARDRAFAAAAGKIGIEKARALIAALDALELDRDLVRSNYAGVAEEITLADPGDETGFLKRQNADMKFAGFMEKLGALRSTGDLEGVEVLIAETLNDPAIEGETRQQVHGHHAGTLASAGKKEEAIAVLKVAVKESPDGPRTKELEEFIELLEREQAGLPPGK